MLLSLVNSVGIEDYCATPTVFPVGVTTMCTQCKPGYIMLIYSKTTTLCVVAPVNPLTPCTIDPIMYPAESTAASTFQFDQFPATTNRQAFCFSCDFFYNRAVTVSNVPQAASNQCNSPSGVNSGCTWSTVSSSFYINSIFSFSLGCQSCKATSPQTQIIAYPLANIYIRDCQQPATTQLDTCQLNEYYNPKARACVDCKILFPNCAACNQTQCLMCPANYYLHKNVYDYETKTFRTQCVFDVCPKNTCKNPLSNTCDTISTDLTDKCVICTVIGANKECEQCAPGLVPAADRLTCNAPTTPLKNVNYFVKSFAPYDPSVYTTDAYSPIAGCTALVRGAEVSCPYLFIQEAINNLLTLQNSYLYDRIVATIFLFQGDHYFFQCDGDENQAANTAYSTAQKYCDGSFLPIMQRKQWINDRIYITVKPMYCSLQTTLGYTVNTDFTAWCAKDGIKPKIYVNAANFYFNITGEMAFENIAFTGINQMLVTSAGVDYSKFPATFCQAAAEPTGYDIPFNLSANTTKLAPQFSSFRCVDQWYTGGLDVDMTHTNRRCQMNNFQKFSNDIESSLSCTGEPYDPNFFVETNGVYTKRRKTLFNLYAFPNHMSNLKIPPSLNLTGCDFKYFLGGYESLINIEYNNLKKFTKTFTWTTTVSGLPVTTNTLVTQYYFNGADKGARIKIVSSNFKNSRFCKGMIVHRKPIQIFQESVITNFTHLFSFNTNTDKSSYITIQQCSFNQMNIFTNITALAAYNSGMTPNVTISDVNQLESFTYKGFIHLGIILNLEDFGGNVEVMNSQFTKNIHFFPEAAIMPRKPSAEIGLEQFRRSQISPEYKMTACDMDTKTDLNFFTNGFQLSDDVDSFFDKFERMSVIYISRNKKVMYFKQNRFWRNTGTFGGAITINSPNFQTSGRPYLIVTENTFEQNMGLMGGNAIFIRNTMRVQDQGMVCAGGYIENSIFNQNIGLKAHNGGAISAICDYLDNPYHDDYSSGSSIKSMWVAIDVVQDLLEPIDSVVEGDQTLSVLSFKFYIQGSNFTENTSGHKGTALYFKHISKIKIINSFFQYNSPTSTMDEFKYSPLTLYFTNRATSYLDPSDECLDEFTFLNDCAQSTGMIIDWPKVQGAIHVHHCQEVFCANEMNYEVVIINNCDFEGNDAGAAVEKTFPGDDNALSIYIVGGQSQQITNCEFRNHEGMQDYYAKNVAVKISKFFPSNYYDNAQAPIIRIKINPPSIADNPLTFKTNFTRNLFTQNTNIQVLGTRHTYSGSLISFESNYVLGSKFTPILVMQQNTIRENQFFGNETSLIYVSQSLLNFTDNVIYGNGYLSKFMQKKTKTADIDFESYIFYFSQQYGAVYLIGNEFLGTGLFHNFKNNSYQFNFAEQGSAVTLKIDNQFAHFSNNFYKNLAALKGAALSVYSYDTPRATIRMHNDNFENIFNIYSGAVTTNSDDVDALSLVVYNCTFRSVIAVEGSAIYASQPATLYVNQSVFTDNVQLIAAANRTALIFPQFQKFKWELQLLIDLKYLNYLLNNISRGSGQIYLDTAINTKPLTFTNQIIKNTNISLSEFVDNIFENLTSKTSSAIYAKRSHIRVTSQKQPRSGFRHLRHGGQGAIKVDQGSSLIGENLIFFNNTATDEKGGVISSSGSQTTLFNISFIQNQAKDKGGCIYQSDNSAFTCNYCSFTSNIGKVSAAIYGSNNDLMPIAVNVANSIFFNNSNDESLIYLSNSNARLENLTFIDNIGKLVNNGITILKSIVTTSNITVNYINNKNQLSLNVDTGFFSVQQQGNLTVNRGSRFQNCKGSKASVIGVSGGSSLYIDQDTYFSMNTGISTISVQLANQVRIQNTQFINNGDHDIYVERSSIQLINTSFVGTASNSIYSNVGNISIFNTTFRDSKNLMVLGKAIYCNCQTLLVDSCNFTNLQALEGGTMYLTSSSPSSTFVIKNSLFFKNTAMHGGAIKMMDGAKVIFSSNLFLQNSAVVIDPPNFLSRKIIQSGIGAALNLDCNNELQGLSRNCDVNLINNNSFINNSAQGDGGAIIFLANLYKDDKTTYFSGNTAKYGSNIASYPRELQIEFLNNGDLIYPVTSAPNLLKKLKNGRVLQVFNTTKNLTFPTIVSGQTFHFNVYIIDQNGQLLSGEDKAIAQFDTSNPQALVIGNIVVAKGGIFNFSNVMVTLPPGSQANFDLTVTGIETYGNDVPFFQTPISVNLTTRKCAKGEKYTSDGKCIQCDSSNYLFMQPHKPTECISCPNEAICFGLDNIAPRAGYYRVSIDQAIFYQCPNQKACIQGNQSSPLGECAPGYTATMCANCQSGYRKSAPYECTKCPNLIVNFLYLIVLALITGLIVVLLVRAHLMVEEKQGSVYQVLLKLLIHHFHFMGILMNVEYFWPQELISFQGAYNYFSGISQEIFSFDCFLQSGVVTDETPRVQSLKLIFFATLPLIILLGSTILWGIIGIVKRQFHELKTQIVASTLVVFFILHPSIARIYFSQFNCIAVGSQSFLRDDITTECFKGVHIVHSMVIALPALLIWIFGVPIAIGIILYKRKDLIEKMANASTLTKLDKNQITELKKKYGYMFVGYKYSMFLWELVIVFIKIGFVMATVFLKAVSSETQVLVGLLILITSMILHVRFRPFGAQRVNNLWLYTFQVTSLTMYAGMFFVSGQHYSYMQTQFIKIFFIVLIMIPNFVYFLFWIKIMRIEILKIALRRSKNAFKLLSCSMVDVEEFQRVHMRDGVDEDDLDIDGKAAALQNQQLNEESKYKGKSKRSELYKDGTPQDDQIEDPQNYNGTKKMGQKVFASEDENFYGIKPKEDFPQSSDSESRKSMGGQPPNYESEKSNGYATKNPTFVDNQDQFPSVRRINSPTNLDITNTSRRHTMNRFLDTDNDISQYTPNTHRKIHPESILTQRERPNVSPLDRSERDQFVFDSYRKPQKKSKQSKNASKRSRPHSESDDENLPSSSRVHQNRGITKNGQSARRNQSFMSEVHDDTNAYIEDDHIEIDEIHLSDEDDAYAPHHNGIFNTFNQTFKSKQGNFKDDDNAQNQQVQDDRSQNKKRKRKSYM